jgi:HAD superfamily hydrolase (TIGR01458 family)
VLIDIDGVLTVSWQPLPGAVQAIAALRDGGLPFALLTNTTSRSRSWIAGALRSAGFPVGEADIYTAPVLTAAYLAEHHPGARCLLLNSGDIAADLSGVTLATGDQKADVVVVGGAGPEFSYAALNHAFRQLMDGAALVAMHRNLYWRTEHGLQLDGGAFLRGLEEAAGKQAMVIGKPAAAFFATALAALGAAAGTTIMIGDDLDNDVLAAQRHGMTGVLVRTGKYRHEALERAAAQPDHVLDSIAGLPLLLEKLYRC